MPLGHYWWPEPTTITSYSMYTQFPCKVTRRGGEWKSEVAYGQNYYHSLFTAIIQKVKKVEHVHCRCAQLVHCHLYGIPPSEGQLRRTRRAMSVIWPAPSENLSFKLFQSLSALLSLYGVRNGNCSVCSLRGQTHTFRSRGLRHKTVQITQVSGASAKESEMGIWKEATPKLRAEGHCCLGVADLCPELALVMPCSWVKGFVHKAHWSKHGLVFQTKTILHRKPISLGILVVFVISLLWL